MKLYAYGSRTPLPIMGEFKYRVLYNRTYYSLIFQVIQGYGGNILSNRSLLKMGIVQILNTVEKKNNEELIQKLMTQYPKLFSGKIGKLKNVKVKLHINPKIKPVRQRRRPVSFHLRAGVTSAIQEMLKNDIIEPVNGPTEWVSPIVPVVKPNNQIRVCTDARMLNKAITLFSRN